MSPRKGTRTSPERGCILRGVGDNGRFAPSGAGLVPNTESAKKRVRQSAKRRALNNWRKRRIKTQVKSFLTAIQAKDLAQAETEYRKVQGILDRIACTGTIHRNTAARRKSRLSRQLRELKSAA
ncbi:MAG: 30S ribosomal protein S20 [Planctomycetaceae bacterium]|nr:30S ribosomal protein S20 [Planctomycetaceae bacterium]